MKTSPEKIILDIESVDTQKKIFLISGNEPTLIKCVELALIKFLKKDGEHSVDFYENTSLKGNINFDLSPLLFSNYHIVVHSNPKDVDLKYFEGCDFENTAVILSFPNMPSTSKIKKSFDSHKEFCSISCYSMDASFKKKFLDRALNTNSIQIEDDGYWFFLDRSSSFFGLFEKEVAKLIDYSEPKMGISDIRLLLSNSADDHQIENLFFLILADKATLVTQSRIFLTSSNESYILLQRIKFFFDILLKSKNISDAKNNFPRYLFRKNESFLTIFKKLNNNKAYKILNLIKKTEILLRKNNSLHLSISQRFLLNLKSSLK